MELKEDAKKEEDSNEVTLAYCDFPSEHWTCIYTNDVIKLLNREVHYNTRVLGSFHDSNLAPHAGLCRLCYMSSSNGATRST